MFIADIHTFHSQDLRVQLSQERDTVRHLSLQKEIEHKDLQNRIDKIVCISFGGFL